MTLYSSIQAFSFNNCGVYINFVHFWNDTQISAIITSIIKRWHLLRDFEFFTLFIVVISTSVTYLNFCVNCQFIKFDNVWSYDCCWCLPLLIGIHRPVTGFVLDVITPRIAKFTPNSADRSERHSFKIISVRLRQSIAAIISSNNWKCPM